VLLDFEGCCLELYSGVLLHSSHDELYILQRVTIDSFSTPLFPFLCFVRPFPIPLTVAGLTTRGRLNLFNWSSQESQGDQSPIVTGESPL
jgi:hypothetical protein